MSALGTITKVDANAYTYAEHTIVFSRPAGKKSAWLITVSGPDINDSLIVHGQRDALAKEAALEIKLYRQFRQGEPKLKAMRLGQEVGVLPTVKYGRLVR